MATRLEIQSPFSAGLPSLYTAPADRTAPETESRAYTYRSAPRMTTGFRTPTAGERRLSGGTEPVCHPFPFRPFTVTMPRTIKGNGPVFLLRSDRPQSENRFLRIPPRRKRTGFSFWLGTEDSAGTAFPFPEAEKRRKCRRFGRVRCRIRSTISGDPSADSRPSCPAPSLPGTVSGWGSS